MVDEAGLDRSKLCDFYFCRSFARFLLQRCDEHTEAVQIYPEEDEVIVAGMPTASSMDAVKSRQSWHTRLELVFRARDCRGTS